MSAIVRGLALGVAALAVAVATGGCWNAIPIGHRALIQILAVDPARGGRLAWTFFQANPTALAEMGSGGGTAGPGGGTTSQQVTPIAVVAPTLADAYRQAQTLTSRDLYLGQLQQVVLSERLTPSQIELVVDSLAHTNELDQSQQLFAAPAGAAATILKPDPQELFPATYLDHVTSCPTCSVVSLHVSLLDAFLRTRTAWETMVLPEVRPSPLGLSVQGAAVYQGPRLVARLGQAQTALLALLRGQPTKTALSLAHVPGVGAASVRALKATSHIVARWRGGRLWATVRLHVTGDLLSVEPDRGLAAASVTPAVDAALSRRVVAQGSQLLAALMVRGADPLEFGRDLWLGDPSAAPSPTAWLAGLRAARVRLVVRSDVRAQGSVR